jgi:lipoprotein-releasing system ATP-binding protein
MNSNIVLRVEGLSKQYRSGTETLRILDAVSLELSRGEIVAITGPSGIGKTTLLNIIGTLDKADAGSVTIDGRSPAAMADAELSRFRAESLGFVFQFHYLLPEFTALENVQIPARILEMPTDEMEQRARELLKAVGVENREQHKPGMLSGGERQRVAIARALMNRPALVLADEPTGNLDPENAEKLVELIKSLRDDYQQSFLIATHSRSLAAACDRQIQLS